MIEAKNLVFQHKTGQHPVVQDINLVSARGELVAIVGPNGSGKTTLFQCLLGLWPPTEGDVLICGTSLKNLSRREIAHRVASVPQYHEPPFPYSVLDVVLTGRAAHIGVFASPAARDLQAAWVAMETVDIAELAQRPYTQISGGERQLALIARCLAQGVPVMLLDEPTSHLDFRNQIVVLEKMRSVVKTNGLTAVLNMHDPNLALLFADRAMLLKSGRVISQGPPRQVITRENLKTLYDLEVSFLSGNGMELVCPRLSLERIDA